MTPIEALILGIIQGLTEFFPVSSSGHLKLAQAIFGFNHLDEYILFDLTCHLGTLVSIFWVFWSEIKELLFKNHKQMALIALGTLPLFPLLLIMKPIKAVFDQPQFLGYAFIITAILLWIGVKVRPKESTNRWRDALFIGGFQALAIFPGISRSGSTISGARLMGWTPAEALSFSFLLAIPAIFGGIVIEAYKALTLTSESTLSIGSLEYAIGFFASLIVGTSCLNLLKRLVKKHSFMYFAWYCLIIGIISLYLFS